MNNSCSPLFFALSIDYKILIWISFGIVSFFLVHILAIVLKLQWLSFSLKKNQKKTTTKTPKWFKIILKFEIHAKFLPIRQINMDYLIFIGYHTSQKTLQRYIAGSSKCSTKPLSLLLTKIITTVKEHLQTHCETLYVKNVVNQMWILKNSKKLHLKNFKTYLT